MRMQGRGSGVNFAISVDTIMRVVSFLRCIHGNGISNPVMVLTLTVFWLACRCPT